jgi:uncharacterized protein YcgI (DUF1989 family)
VLVRTGQRVRITDAEGNQVADTWAFSAEDISEYHSAEHTRVHLSRLFPRVGEQFVTNRRRPILKLLEDNTPGIHDMLCAACDPTRYELLGVIAWHASCQENLQNAMRALGFTHVDIPQPINLFMNTPVTGDGVTIDWRPAETQPGDSVVLRAEMDCYLCVSSCPQDIISVNGDGPTRIRMDIE